MKKGYKLYTELFLSTLYLSAFTVGGGYVIVPLMKEKFVDKLGWIDEEEMLNMIAIAQSSPGAVAVNASILLGYKLGGVFGAVCTVLGAIIPPLITISILSFFYNSFKDNKIVSTFLKGMQAGVAALIINVVINMSRSIFKKTAYFGISLIVLSFIASFILKINVVFIILLGGLIGLARHFYTDRKIEKLKNSRRR